jgi:glycosyltransferase involved in cell wall biosynthesis
MSTISKSTLSIIVPCYNEESNIKNLYNALQKVLEKKTDWDIYYLFVNDGSRDNTWEKILEISKENSNLRGLNLSRNFGKEAALLAGIEQCPQSDAYLTLDADLQDDPSIITEMLDKIKKGNDIVYGKRNERTDPIWYIFCTSIFYYFMDLATKGAIPKNVADFYVFNNRVRNEFLKLQESVRFSRGLIFYTGFKKDFVLYKREKRQAGSSSFNFIKLAKLSLDGLTSFSTLPLHLISIVGIIGCFVSIFSGILYVAISLITRNNSESGWASIILLITFFGSLQILMLGIISEYIARNTIELKNRQKYIVMDKINID